jgi:hypothetical protein
MPSSSLRCGPVKPTPPLRSGAALTSKLRP